MNLMNNTLKISIMMGSFLKKATLLVQKLFSKQKYRSFVSKSREYEIKNVLCIFFSNLDNTLQHIFTISYKIDYLYNTINYLCCTINYFLLTLQYFELDKSIIVKLNNCSTGFSLL